MNDDMPAELDKIIRRCLRKDPGRRAQNVCDIKIALQELKEEIDSGTLNEPAAPRLLARRRFGVWEGITAVLVITAGLALLYFRQSLNEPAAPVVIPLTSYMGTQESPSFSPDGTRVAFSWNGEKRDNYDIFIKPIWGSNGRELLFTSDRNGRRSLWRIEAVPGARPRLMPGTDDAGTFDISKTTPSHLVYVLSRRNMNIWRARLSDSGSELGVPEQIVAFSGLQDAPQLSPDGTRITFNSDRSGYNEMMVSESDGSNPVALTSFKRERLGGAPRWSPDGRWITFDSTGPDGVNLFIVDSQGGAPRRLTSGYWRDIKPSWSRDGRWVSNGVIPGRARVPIALGARTYHFRYP
jgi:Tol biopolymer transport system component